MPRNNKKAPQWAYDYIKEIMQEKSGAVILKWRDSMVKKGTSGRAYGNVEYSVIMRIVITAGSETWQHRYVVLHEIAHLIAPSGSHHNEEFYRIAFSLYRRYLPEQLDEIAKREGLYRKASLKVYDEMRVTE